MNNEIKIGDKFEKPFASPSKKRVECVVYDIVELTRKSTLRGTEVKEIVYMAVSKEYGMIQPFSVSKTTIKRFPIK